MKTLRCWAAILLALCLTACGGEEVAPDPGNVWAESVDAYFGERTEALKGSELPILYDEDGDGQGEEQTALIRDARLSLIGKAGESPRVEAEYSIQAWQFAYEVQLDVEDVTAVVRTDGREPDNPWFDLNGERVVLLKYDTVDQWVSSRAELSAEEWVALSGEYKTGDEALFDWYLRTNGFAASVPPYVTHWEETAVHREDGEGWMVYVPTDWQEEQTASTITWTSPDGERLSVHHLALTAQETGENAIPAPDGGVYQITHSGDSALLGRVLDSFRADPLPHSWAPAHVLHRETAYPELSAAIGAALWEDLPGSTQTTQWKPLRDDGSGTAYGVVTREIAVEDVFRREFRLPAVVQYREQNGTFTVTKVEFPDEYEDGFEELDIEPVWPHDTFTDDLPRLASIAAESQGETARLLLTELVSQSERHPTAFNQLLYGDNGLTFVQKDWLHALAEKGVPADILPPPDDLTVQNLALQSTPRQVWDADGPYRTASWQLLHRGPVQDTGTRVDFLAYVGRYTAESGPLQETAGAAQLVTAWLNWNGVAWELDSWRATAPEGDQRDSHWNQVQQLLPEAMTLEQVESPLEALHAKCNDQAKEMHEFNP